MIFATDDRFTCSGGDARLTLHRPLVLARPTGRSLAGTSRSVTCHSALLTAQHVPRSGGGGLQTGTPVPMTALYVPLTTTFVSITTTFVPITVRTYR
jgi:hypothetical protein